MTEEITRITSLGAWAFVTVLIFSFNKRTSAGPAKGGKMDGFEDAKCRPLEGIRAPDYCVQPSVPWVTVFRK